MRKNKFVASVALAALISQTASCGYILYPERVGQGDTGKLDPVVVALDAVGLLFWLIPGVVAFVIDYNNGTIFLPDGLVSNETGENSIQLSKKQMTQQGIEKAIAKHTGKTIKLDDSKAQREVIEEDQLDDYLAVSL